MTAFMPLVTPSKQSAELPLENGDRLDQPTFHRRYEAMPAGFRAELISGRVHVPSPAKGRHSSNHGRVMGWLMVYQSRTPNTQFYDNGTIYFGADGELQPDACLTVDGGQTHFNEDDYMVGPPEFVVEVASSSVAYDLFDKRAAYETAGVREYLVLLVREGRAVWFVRSSADKSRFTETPPDSDGIHRSPTIPGLWLDAAALLRGDCARVIEVVNMGTATMEHAAFVAKARL